MRDGFTQALEARVNAQRRILTWLVANLDESDGARLLAELNETFPPQDGQEDPGAVPVEAFGATSAFALEVRAILEPLKHRTKRPEPS